MFDMSEPLSDHDLDRLAALLPLISAWCSAVDAEILKRLQAGSVFKNASIKPTRPTRKWVDENLALQQLLVFKQLDEVAPRSVLSPAQVEELLGKSKFKDFAPFVRKESSGVKVAYQMAIPFD